MNPSKFIDNLKVVCEQLETHVTQILTHKKKVSDKVEMLAIQLLNFKCEILKSIRNVVKSITKAKQTNQFAKIVTEQMQNELKSNQSDLRKYRLHSILRNKLKKMRKQSMINSTVGEQPEDISKLQKSVILIEKDLRIQTFEHNDKYNISSIINRSILSLEDTPIRHTPVMHDESITSQNSMTLDVQCINAYMEVNDYQIRKNQYHEDAENKSEENLKGAIKNQSSKKPPLPVKKKKKSVYSSTDGSNKGNLLGNLLDQSYQICMEEKQKQ